MVPVKKEIAKLLFIARVPKGKNATQCKVPMCLSFIIHSTRANERIREANVEITST